MILPDTILLMLGMLACSLGQVQQENRYFEVVQATSQVWIAGVAGGGKGIDYTLRIKIKTNSPIAFDSIWLAGKRLDIKPEKGGTYAAFKLAKNDVVTLRASDYQGRPGKNGRQAEKVNASPTDSAKAPMEYEGKALLKYVVDGTAKYFAVPHITILPPIYGQ